MVDYDRFLIYFQGTIVDLTDTDTSNVFIVINGTDQYLCRCFRITFRSRNVI